MRPRFVRTQREMEGRFEDVWALVDEDDDLETWPEEAELQVVGRPATAPGRPAPRRAAPRATPSTSRLPGMLEARVVRAPVARCRVTNARPRRRARRRPASAPCSGRTGRSRWAATPVLTAEPHWAGAPVAAVAADTPDALAEGIAALALDVRGARPARPRRRPRASSASRRSRARRVRGDPDAALAGAEVLVELTCETPAHVQTPLEPHAAVARWDGDRLTAWVSTQGMFDARRELAARFGLPSESVRVISEFIGGGFGAKQGAGVEALLAAELARAAGRPVRLAHRPPRGAARRRTARADAPDRHASARAATGRCSAIELDAVVEMGAGRLDLPRRRARPVALRLRERPRRWSFPVRTSLRAQNAFRAPGCRRGRDGARAGDGRARRARSASTRSSCAG